MIAPPRTVRAPPRIAEAEVCHPRRVAEGDLTGEGCRRGPGASAHRRRRCAGKAVTKRTCQEGT
ncbi:hypothetical protein FRAAL2199 [Frankia alni ACN14a]|uniref:Uncharacterized protein n=1 Tax=Frankia alni (strain DSM 45986 / CECT 9034 / ACN14a) TaxID=326424 RepID=Q0RNN8_FRAAA|nr:hypothetical protein FRAAL2199 [Frankia alni ACN14a]